MGMNQISQVERLLFLEVDRTTYEISVKLSEDAKMSAEELIVKMIAADITDRGEENGDV